MEKKMWAAPEVGFVEFAANEYVATCTYVTANTCLGSGKYFDIDWNKPWAKFLGSWSNGSGPHNHSENEESVEAKADATGYVYVQATNFSGSPNSSEAFDELHKLAEGFYADKVFSAEETAKFYDYKGVLWFSPSYKNGGASLPVGDWTKSKDFS